MEYYKINYDKLKNIPQIKFYKLVVLLIILLVILIIPASKYKISKKINIYGECHDRYIELEIDTNLSDILINNSVLEFNGRKMNYKIYQFNDYEIVNNAIYQKIDLTVDEKVYQNEVGIVTINYDEQTILKYIFELFK